MREGLTKDQRAFLAARLGCTTDKEAAEKCGLKQNTPAVWKCLNEDFKTAYEALWTDGLEFAKATHRQMLAEAVMQHWELLTDPDAKVQLGAVKLLYQAQGLIVQRSEASGPGGGPLHIIIDDGDNDDSST